MNESGAGQRTSKCRALFRIPLVRSSIAVSTNGAWEYSTSLSLHLMGISNIVQFVRISTHAYLEAGSPLGVAVLSIGECEQILLLF